MAAFENCNEIIINAQVQSDDFTLEVKVGKARYGPYLYWQVKCDQPCLGSFHSHPFVSLYEKYGPITIIYSINMDNKLQRTLLEFLTKTQDDLKEEIGNTSDAQYRSNIIKALTLFRD